EAAPGTADHIVRLLARPGATGLSQRNAHDLRANYLWRLAHALRRRGKPADALRLAEESNEIFRQLVAGTPEHLEFGVGLFLSWEQIGKAHSDLDRPDEALAAWLQGVEVMRRVVAQAPSELSYRR